MVSQLKDKVWHSTYSATQDCYGSVTDKLRLKGLGFWGPGFKSIGLDRNSIEKELYVLAGPIVHKMGDHWPVVGR